MSVDCDAVKRRGGDGFVACGRTSGCHSHDDDSESERGHAHSDCHRSLAGYRLNTQVLAAIHPEQHDDEEEQHHYRARIDDDLHGRQELSVHSQEQHSHAEEGRHQHEG